MDHMDWTVASSWMFSKSKKLWLGYMILQSIVYLLPLRTRSWAVMLAGSRLERDFVKQLRKYIDYCLKKRLQLAMSPVVILAPYTVDSSEEKEFATEIPIEDELP